MSSRVSQKTPRKVLLHKVREGELNGGWRDRNGGCLDEGSGGKIVSFQRSE